MYFREREIYFKELFHTIEGTSKVELCRVTWQTGDPAQGWHCSWSSKAIHPEAESWDQGVGRVGFFFFILNSIYLFFGSLYGICYNIAPVLCFAFFHFKFIYVLNWRIISLQNCVGFCQTPAWIIHIGFDFFVLELWDPSSSTRDWTHTPCLGRWRLNPWTTRVGFFWSLSSQLASLLTVSSYSLPSVHVCFPNFLFY